MLFQTLRKAEESSEKYNSTLKRLNEIQPGIIEKYNLQAKSLERINLAEKELIANIMKRAETEARTELIKEKIKKSMQLREESKEYTGFMENIMYGDSRKRKAIAQANELEQEANTLANQQVESEMSDKNMDVVSPGRTQQQQLIERFEKRQETLTIDFKNLPPGVEVSGGGSAGITMPTVGNTRK